MPSSRQELPRLCKYARAKRQRCERDQTFRISYAGASGRVYLCFWGFPSLKTQIWRPGRLRGEKVKISTVKI